MLLDLSKDENIIVTRPDKGNGVVLMNRDDYVSKMDVILNDRTKFEAIRDDILMKILNKEEKINRFLRKLKSDGVINESLYSQLFTSGSKPGVLYGLPKVHKENCPLRPIMSAIGTFNYKLSKFLVPILSPITINQYTVKDSFSFAKEIGNLNFGNCVLASFDVKSLFTNIPLTETIDICIEGLFQDKEFVQGFNKNQMHTLLSLAAKECFFMFNKKTFAQKDGVAMRNPFSECLFISL